MTTRSQLAKGWRSLAQKLNVMRSVLHGRRRSSGPAYPADFSRDEIEILRAVSPYTMTSAEKVVELLRAVDYVSRARVPGAIVECGVWKGGSMMAVASRLRQLGDTSRPLYLFDTFEGMTQPQEIDRTPRGELADRLLAAEDRGSSWLWARAPIEVVQDAMAQAQYPVENICFVKGRVEDTIPDRAPSQISLLRLDTDWYQSTYHELLHLYPRLCPGGVLIIDDYGEWEGARRAVDQYFAEQGVSVFLHRIDYAGRLLVKPADKPVPSGKSP